MPSEDSGKSDLALAVALEREHREVDAGLSVFLTELEAGRVDADGLDTVLEALRRHIYAEERILFPPIRHGGMAMPVAVMMAEHGTIWRAMEALAACVAAGDRDRIGEAGRNLLDHLAEHNAKEEDVIYPAADTGLAPEQAADLADFIATGLMPDFWECLEADAD